MDDLKKTLIEKSVTRSVTLDASETDIDEEDVPEIKTSRKYWRFNFANKVGATITVAVGDGTTNFDTYRLEANKTKTIGGDIESPFVSVGTGKSLVMTASSTGVSVSVSSVDWPL